MTLIAYGYKPPAKLLLRHPVMLQNSRPFVLRRIPCTGVSNKSHSSGAFFYLVGAIYPTRYVSFSSIKQNKNS